MIHLIQTALMFLTEYYLVRIRPVFLFLICELLLVCVGATGVIRRKVAPLRCLAALFFSLYLGTVFAFTLFSRGMVETGVMIAPFHTIFDYMRDGQIFQLLEILFNCMLLFPYGLLFTVVFGKKADHLAIPTAFALSLLVETSQLLFHLGIFDLDDLFFNTAGAACGVCCRRLFCGIAARHDPGA